MVLAFGDHRLDIKRRELRRGTDIIDLEPKVFDLLAFLVQNRDRVVSKDDLLQQIWAGGSCRNQDRPLESMRCAGRSVTTAPRNDWSAKYAPLPLRTAIVTANWRGPRASDTLQAPGFRAYCRAAFCVCVFSGE